MKNKIITGVMFGCIVVQLAAIAIQIKNIRDLNKLKKMMNRLDNKTDDMINELDLISSFQMSDRLKEDEE